MSFKVTSLSWSEKTGGPLTKLVLVCLSEYANESGLCWPSVATIAARCEVSERTIQKEIRKLEALNLVKTSPSPGRTSNRYTVSTPSIGQGSVNQPRPMDTPTPSIKQGYPVQYAGSTPSNGHPIRSVDPVNEPPKKGKLSPVQLISLEKERERTEKRIDVLRKIDCRNPSERDELRAAKLRVQKIDEATYVPL